MPDDDGYVVGPANGTNEFNIVHTLTSIDGSIAGDCDDDILYYIGVLNGDIITTQSN